MYHDLLEQLKDFTDEQFGKFTRILIRYDKDGIIPKFDDLQLKLAFQMLKPNMDRNKEKYEETCEQRRIAGSLGGKQKAINLANASKCYQNLANLPNLADNDIDNDNDNVKDNDSIKEKESLKEKKDVGQIPTNVQNPLISNISNLKSNNIDDIKEKDKKEKFAPPTLEEVKEYAKSRNRLDIAEKFFDYFNAGNWIDSKGNKVKNWKQKFITWENSNRQSYQQKEDVKCSARQLDNGVWKI